LLLVFTARQDPTHDAVLVMEIPYKPLQATNMHKSSKYVLLKQYNDEYAYV
jgi:hypothetical protein